jgi:hypothetical protein
MHRDFRSKRVHFDFQSINTYVNYCIYICRITTNNVEMNPDFRVFCTEGKGPILCFVFRVRSGRPSSSADVPSRGALLVYMPSDPFRSGPGFGAVPRLPLYVQRGQRRSASRA